MVNEWLLTLIMLSVSAVVAHILTKDHSELREKVEESVYGKMPDFSVHVCSSCGQRMLDNVVHICRAHMEIPVYRGLDKGEQE